MLTCNLEQFQDLVAVAKADFTTISGSRDAHFYVKQASISYPFSNESCLRAALGACNSDALTPKALSIIDSSKPWGKI
jgi:hypothetical protein